MLSRLQLPYMTTAQRTAVTPNDKDVVYDTDLHKIFIGDGSTVGGLDKVAGDRRIMFCQLPIRIL